MKVMKEDFETALTAKVGFKGYGLQEEELKKQASFEFEG